MRYEILNENNEVVNTIVADLVFVEEVYPGRYREVPEIEVPVINTWIITKLAFKARFPRAKWVAAKQLALANPAIADFFEDFDLATYIDVSSTSTIAAVDYFKSEIAPAECKLTEEEAAAILLPATDVEKP